MIANPAAASDASSIITSLTRHDILMGRGAPLAYYEGNVWFRDLIAPWKDLYASTKLQKQKCEIARRIYFEIGTHNGRFLAKAPPVQSMVGAVPTTNTKQWVIVDEDKALEKIKQALREKSHVSTVDAPIATASSVQATAIDTSDNGDDSNAVSIPTREGESVTQEQRKQKRRRGSPRRRRVESTAAVLPSTDSNFHGMVVEQHQQQLLEPSRFASASSATLAPALDEAQRLHSVEMLRQQLHLYEHQPAMPLQTFLPPAAQPLPPPPTLPLGTASSTASLPTMAALAALLLPPQQPPQQHYSVVENMLIRQREQRLQLEMLQQRQHQNLRLQLLQQQLQQQQQQQQHVSSGSLLFPGSTLPPNSNPFLASHGDFSLIPSRLWIPPVLIDRAATAWNRSLLTNEHIERLAAAPEVAIAGPPNPDAALWGVIPRVPTNAPASHLSNHSTGDDGTHVAMEASATTNDDDKDCKPRARKQTRH